jgi:hypothetical protein
MGKAASVRGFVGQTGHVGYALFTRPRGRRTSLSLSYTGTAGPLSARLSTSTPRSETNQQVLAPHPAQTGHIDPRLHGQRVDGTENLLHNRQRLKLSCQRPSSHEAPSAAPFAFPRRVSRKLRMGSFYARLRQPVVGRAGVSRLPQLSPSRRTSLSLSYTVTTGPFPALLSTSTPRSVTTTRSSILTPPQPVI